MLASITPLGERGRTNRYAVTATWFIAGAVAGGAALGTAASLIGVAARAIFGVDEWSAPVAGGTLAVVAVIATVDGLAGRRLVPSPHRQVDERWLDRYRGWVYGGGFGFQLGTGVTTIVPVGSFPVALAAAVLAPLPWGVVVGAAFGLTRGLSILLNSRVKTPADLLDIHRRINAGTSRVLAACRVVTVLIAAVALGAAFT